MRQAYAALLLALTACGHGKAPTFNELPSGPATAPATAPSAPESGSSTLTLTGEVTLASSRDFQCSYAKDDFFVGGTFDNYEGIPLYLSINVEFYKNPGRYARKTQVLVRRISTGSQFYASWVNANATGTVLARGKGFDLTTTLLQPESGTEATKPVTIAGHFGCLPI